MAGAGHIPARAFNRVACTQECGCSGEDDKADESDREFPTHDNTFGSLGRGLGRDVPVGPRRG